ncbi:hypothetical protein CTA2_1793 [Colletotrichum tanaceti]|uniref:HNH nuclease domain-containing protein n=1 Tax=Colletotrichum tanaceti TaxID=1306861 RepID=A0A4U6XC88_9PEZI|nr:hypothetical protein CTA2_1793 [Colletotrichum tanaceti]TKW53350.1 hypothetical protein CTA1_2550 [Colletotrichum tanaceti]
MIIPTAFSVTTSPNQISAHLETTATMSNAQERPAPRDALATARAEHDKAQRVSVGLLKRYKKLHRRVKPVVEPDEEQPEPDYTASHELAALGIELASQDKEAIRLERKVVREEKAAGLLSGGEAKKCLRDLDQRFFSAGDQLWTHQKMKIRLSDPDDPNEPDAMRMLDPRSNALSDCLLAIYKKCDGLTPPPKRDPKFRQNTLDYYECTGLDQEDHASTDVLCQISGQWFKKEEVIAAHIVPFFLDIGSIGEILFGSRAESLQKAGNALVLHNQIEKWFNKYFLVVVPVDPAQKPTITRWRTDVLSSAIRNTRYAKRSKGGELDGKELTFCNNKRPVSRFLYFHFIMALVRIRNTERQGWQNIWARYHQHRPFPTPGPYIRKTMLLALATHFSTTDMNVVTSWMTDNGFETPLKLADDEATEVARRILKEVSARAEQKSSQMLDQDDQDDQDDNDDNDGFEEEDSEDSEEED